jgi:hypothetical protein
LSPEEIRAAAEVHAELGPEYRDAVLESFLAKVDREIDARVEERLGAKRPAKARKTRPVADERQRGWSAGLVSGLVVGTLVAGIPVSILVHVTGAGSYFDWQDRLWFIWVAIAVVYMAGAALVTTRNRHRRQLAAGAAQGKNPRAGA